MTYNFDDPSRSHDNQSRAGEADPVADRQTDLADYEFNLEMLVYRRLGPPIRQAVTGSTIVSTKRLSDESFEVNPQHRVLTKNLGVALEVPSDSDQSLQPDMTEMRMFLLLFQDGSAVVVTSKYSNSFEKNLCQGGSGITIDANLLDENSHMTLAQKTLKYNPWMKKVFSSEENPDEILALFDEIMPALEEKLLQGIRNNDKVARAINDKIKGLLGFA